MIREFVKDFSNSRSLTRTESKILSVILSGQCSSRDIANATYTSQHTVNNHVKNILDKAEARSKTEVTVQFSNFLAESLLYENALLKMELRGKRRWFDYLPG